MSGLALFLITSGSMALGFIVGTVRSRARRDSDARVIDALREGLVDTQANLTEVWTAKQEAIVAQERAESALKAAFERKSEAGRRAWVTRKSNAEVSRAS